LASSYFPVERRGSLDIMSDRTSRRKEHREDFYVKVEKNSVSPGLYPSHEGEYSVTFDFPGSGFVLESGEVFYSLTVNYQTYGELSDDRDNVIYIAHALTGGSLVGGPNPEGKEKGWWEPLVGPGKAVDTKRYFVICSNVLGGCYGTTGPSSPDKNGRPFAMSFPVVTTRDMVRLQKVLLDYLDIKKLLTVIGGSMGGMQALEWALNYPEMVHSIIAIACSGRMSPLGIAYNQVARNAIMRDIAWRNGDYYGEDFPYDGLSLARIIGTITYRCNSSFELRFGRQFQEEGNPFSFNQNFAVESYLKYQGDKITRRFDPNTYLYLTKAMDLHDLGRGYPSYQQALKRIRGPAYLLGISSDILFYPQEVQGLAVDLRRSGVEARYYELESPHGHDAFLMEFEKMEEYLWGCLEDITAR